MSSVILSLGIRKTRKRTSEMMMENKKVAFCFDGSVADQVLFDDEQKIEGKVVYGVRQLFEKLYTYGFEINIYSTRCRTLEGFKAVTHWLVQHSLLEYVSNVTPYAPDGGVVVDSRCVEDKDMTLLFKKVASKERRYEKN